MYIYIYIYIQIHTYTYIYTQHVPKCMSCHKAIVVISGKTHCFMITCTLCPSCSCEI